MKSGLVLWPRTLFGRNVLLIVALVLLGQIGAWLLWYTQVQRPRVDRAVSFVGWHISAVRAALDQLPPSGRESYLARLDRADGVRVLRHLPPDLPPARGLVAGPLMRMFVTRLEERIGRQDTVVWEPAPRLRLWVRVSAGGEDLWCGYPGEGLLPDVSGLVLGVSLTAALLALVGAMLIQRRLNAPLRTLANAASELAAGKSPPPLSEQGPAEIAIVAQSFNRMTAALARMEGERTLMLAGVSHDLRTPMTKLRLGLEMLDNPREAELIASLVRSIETADDIIDQFVDYARIGQDEAPVAADLVALVRHTIDAVAGPDVAIALETCDVPLVDLRPVAAARLVANLLQNAMRHGAAPLRVGIERVGSRVRLVVCDRGPGIPESELAHIKQAFVRLDAARGGKPGAGLGLAIAERVARLHGGELMLRNLAAGGFEASVSFAAVPVAA